MVQQAKIENGSISVCVIANSHYRKRSLPTRQNLQSELREIGLRSKDEQRTAEQSEKEWVGPMTESILPHTDLPPLPQTAVTRDGVRFDPQPDQWFLASVVIGGKRNFDFGQFANVTFRFRHCLKLGILWFLMNHSFSHATNVYQRFLAFYDDQLGRENEISVVSLSDILNYKGKLSPKTEWKLGVLRILLEDTSRLGFGITSAEALDYLRDATIRGNVKGTSIRTRDPNAGSFTDSELMSIQSSLNDSFARGEINFYQFAVAWVFLGYGPRPIQVALLKESDLIVSETESGSLYALKMPRVKQRGGYIRESYKTRYCSKQIGQLLQRVISVNQVQREKLGLIGDEWPMFMSQKEGELPGLRHHMNSPQIGYMLNHVASRITGLKTNAKRFRITLGQRAVDDGKDIHTVAELLDHSDTQNVGVYYEASPSMVFRLDRHLAMEMAPLAQAFAGVVVETELDARRGREPTSRIYDRSLADNAANPLGTCGQMSFCGLSIPFACYTCRHFQPWLDGPHDAFMDALIADRERMLEEQYSPKIYAIRDRTILAVAEVIQLCVAEHERRGGIAA